MKHKSKTSTGSSPTKGKGKGGIHGKGKDKNGSGSGEVIDLKDSPLTLPEFATSEQNKMIPRYSSGIHCPKTTMKKFHEIYVH